MPHRCVQANSLRAGIVIDGKPGRRDPLLRSLERPPEAGDSIPGAEECLHLLKVFMEVGNFNDRRIILELVERLAESNRGDRAPY